MSESVLERRAGPGIVLVEGTPPDARSALGLVVSRSETIDLAVDGIRLVSIDFGADDLAAVRECRVVLGGFANHAMSDAAAAAASDPSHARHLRVLHAFLAGGRVGVRSAGARHWAPDFCLARGPGLERWFEGGTVALVGYLGLGANHPYVGPRLTCIISGPGPVAAVALAFERLWSGGHDILDVVIEALTAAQPGGGTAGAWTRADLQHP